MIQLRKWHWSEWVLFGIYLLSAGVSAGYWAYYNSDQWTLLPLWGNFLLVFVIFLIPILFWRPGYVHMGWFPLVVLLTIGIFQLDAYRSFPETMEFLSYPLVIVGFLAHRMNIWWTVPVFIIGFPFAGIWLLDKPGVLDFIQIFFSSGISFLIGLGLQRILSSHLGMKQLYGENVKQYDLIRQQNDALEQYARQVESLTLLEERNRLARELHDTVGHTFTSVIMGMDAVSYLIETHPDKAKEKLEVLRDVTRTGLQEVRKSIHQIAPIDDKAPLAQQISRLANEFAIHTGTSVRVEANDEDGDFPQQLKLTIIRCLQEALTNAKRHGQATSIIIELKYDSELICLMVKDDGLGSDKITTGFGLSGMKERLAAWRGNLQIRSLKGLGTTVICTIPYSRPSVKS
ncbi:sensor histidine kinase [Paenibacillus sp. J2TS4]|uniref:sensor histidine kinase n=1 Tax=Paenibacillus sp. J2TS4 TaxID=2807194 RepID=UPI001B069FE1|nr:sensor histidine kinase [Paenibacillus sp. J2TS4]GIP34037.1 hypothetical protein J2TS4_32470 [Paenibacillus sp. J2TS4]